MVMMLVFGLVGLALVVRVRLRFGPGAPVGSVPGSGWPVRPAGLLSGTPQLRTQPPPGLSVAEVGYLADPARPLAAALGTVVDLTQRGHLRIRVVRRGLFRRTVWQVTRGSGSPTGLSAYETRVLASVVGATDVRRRLTQLAPPVDTSTALTRGWLRKEPLARGAMLLLWSATVILGAMAYLDDGWFGVGLVLVAGVIASRIAWVPHSRTALGNTLHAHVLGLRLHLSTQPQPPPGRLAREQFAALLPYAVALGVAVPWLAAAHEAGITEIDGLDVTEVDDPLSAFDDFADSLCGLGADAGDGGDGGGGD